METLIIEVATEEDALAQAVAAVELNQPQPPRYLFDSDEALLNTLSADRFAILKALCGGDPMSIAELAKRVKRDHAEVQTDAERLASIGLIDRTDSGELLFPYAGVHLELDWRSAA